MPKYGSCYTVKCINTVELNIQSVSLQEDSRQTTGWTYPLRKPFSNCCCYSNKLHYLNIAWVLSYNSRILNNKTLFLAKACSSGHSCTESTISRGLQYMTCGNTQDALNLTHAGLPLFLYGIPHPLNVVVSLFLREFHPYITSRPDTAHTWFTHVSPKRMNFVTIKLAKSRNTHRVFRLATLLPAL